MLGAHVLVTVASNPTLVLNYHTGGDISTVQKADGSMYGLGVFESLCFFLSCLLKISDLHTSVYLAMLQHLLYKQSKSLHLPLEMWYWIAKYRV